MHLYGRTNLFWAQRALLVSNSFSSLLVAFVLQIQGGNLIKKHRRIKDYTTSVLVSMFQKQAKKFNNNKDDLFVWNTGKYMLSAKNMLFYSMKLQYFLVGKNKI